ncbi:SHOCT domain-containing protein [Clostridium sp. 19966]|uniref:SHOCT domain-containing protein n=1 Tax=Clostridium sp. 19966 TaxID=2768166 RepID=UPI0028DE5B2C|nr:SHOCT domain-containing protein [Clostridium sp. 19966]MDT8715138.1 SHOCT domain-containing protein [Clostridium sp. 19966]
MFCGGYGRLASFGLGGGFMASAMIFRLLIIAALIVFALKFLGKYINKSDSTLGVLNEKFAKGEISEEEYLRRKSVLSQKN